MKILGFDLASLFKAPKVTEEPVIPEPQTPMPVEYNEVDTDAPSANIDLWDDNTGPQEPEDCTGENIHKMMYEKSCPPACTIKRDEQVSENVWQQVWEGGSENFQGGSEEIHK